jgi:hypothetical protein
LVHVKSFVAGFVSTLVFHQGLLGILHLVGATTYRPYAIVPTQPLHVPVVLSLAFWGGIWGIALWMLLRRFKRTHRYWLLASVVGAVAPTLVALSVVVPLKGMSGPGIWQPRLLTGALLLNAAWGLGVAWLMRILGED